MKISPELLLKSLSDATRLRCIILLLQQGELCVCELTYALGEIQPKISRHLASLRDLQIVQDRRVGQWVYYQINPSLPEWARQMLAAIEAGCASQKQYRADFKKLEKMPNRPEQLICA